MGGDACCEREEGRETRNPATTMRTTTRPVTAPTIAHCLRFLYRATGRRPRIEAVDGRVLELMASAACVWVIQAG